MGTGVKRMKDVLKGTNVVGIKTWAAKEIDPKSIDWGRVGKYNTLINQLIEMKINSAIMFEDLAKESQGIGPYLCKKAYEKNAADEGTPFILRTRVLGDSVSFLKTVK